MMMRQFRETLGLTLRQVADATGFPLNQVSKDERGVREPSVEEIATYQDFTQGAVRYDDWLALKRQLSEVECMANEAAPAAPTALETADAR